VPRVVKTLSDFFRIAPILAVRADGTVGIGGALFGRSDPYRAFGAFVRRRLDARRRWRVGISHANVPEGAAQVREAIASALPSVELLPVMPLGTALGVHAGPGCVVVAVQELEPAA
jgi:fatty acid-binding protein DegV